MVFALEDVELEVPRQGKDYITARDPDSGKRWRLKGELCEQYETEQRRHSGQIEALRQQAEALRRQVERLSGRVTDLTRYSGTHGGQGAGGDDEAAGGMEKGRTGPDRDSGTSR